MTERAGQPVRRGRGRQRPLLTGLLTAVLTALTLVAAPAGVSAHAEPERAEPPMNGTVPVAPARVEIWFDEEVDADGTSIQVIGPGGIQVDLGDTTLDLMDPNRQRVTVSLRPNLGPGAYTVQWRSLSATDGDSAQGGYLFRVGAATPAASPVAAAATPEPGRTAAAPTPAVDAVAAGGEDDFDAQAFGLSVLAGLVVAVLIYVFWRVVRPRNPKF